MDVTRKPIAGGHWWRWLQGSRRWLLLLLLAAAVWAWRHLQLTGTFQINPGGREMWGSFFQAALHPAWDYQTPGIEGVVRPSLLVRALRAALDTLRMAGAAVALSMAGGLVLGFLASNSWHESGGGWLRRSGRMVCFILVRAFITLSRSIHELIWAILLLSALGITPVAAVLAIAIPYTGTLAKVFSEMVDEAPRDSMNALRAAGAGPLQAWLGGVLPRAVPDLLTYVLYRFECGLRSATILGWWGFGTLGLYIQQSFDNGDYRETWTYLYLMIGMVLTFDAWSALLRRRIQSGGTSRETPDCHTLLTPALLHTSRPRDAILRWSLRALGALALTTLATGLFLEIKWAPGTQYVSGLLDTEYVRPALGAEEWARRGENVRRFLTELTPPPLLPGSTVTWRNWLGGIAHFALPAAWTTLAISVVSVLGAGLLAALLIPLAARTAAVTQPWIQGGRRPGAWADSSWRLIRWTARALLILGRAMPEVILAFLFFQLLGGNVWPAILGLGIHNAGILGRLGAETVENAPAQLPAALRAAGATRLQVLGGGLLPVLLPRFVLFLFYRWETCLRETTALGILGCLTLGYYINQAKAAQRFDVMMVLILTGAGIVILGDLLSIIVRAWLRRAG